MTEDKKVKVEITQSEPVRVVASEELVKQVEDELLIEDPTPEKAEAVLKNAKILSDIEDGRK